MASATGIGVIGAGGISEAHLYAYQRLGERVRLVGVADIDDRRAASAAERFGFETSCADADELLRHDEVDAVSICTPPFTHVDLAVRALEQGKHVLCEKPVAATPADLDEIERAARASGRVFAGVFQLRFGRGAQQVRRLLADRAFGQLRLGMAETLWYRDDAYYTQVPWRGAWSTETGGATVSQAVHMIDALVWFMGEPVSVFADASSSRDYLEVDDSSVAVVRFRNGALGQITSTVNALGEQRARLELHGSDLGAVSTGPEYAATSEPFALSAPDLERAGTLQRQMDEAFPKGYRVLHRGAVTDFIEAIEQRRAPLAGIEACRATLQVTTAIYKSAMTGERVDLPISRDDPFYSALPPEGFGLRA